MSKIRTSHEMQNGLGLIELMIAVALGAIIMLGVTEIATQNSLTRNELEQFGRQLETATYAMRVIETDVTNSAFWGERGEFGPSGTMPEICADTRDELENTMGYPIQGGQVALTDDGIDCVGMPGDKLKPKPDTDFIAIRRASSCAIDPAAGCPTAGNFHMQVHACFDPDSFLVPGDSYLISDNIADLTHLQRDCVNLAPQYRFLNHIYYVSDEDTLVRVELIGNKYVKDELVEDVEFLRFEYGLDTDGDGQVDDYASNVSDPKDPLWAEVVMVRMAMIVRNHKPSPEVFDDRTYSVAGQTYTAASEQGHRRQLYSRTISTRNIAGRREGP
ncbi:MAG: PilW family protein [Halioglobus sp.]